jgi:V8-like Glu-specific endopeptidase
MSASRINKTYRIAVITLSLFSIEANAIGLDASQMNLSKSSKWNSFSFLLKTINVFSDNGRDPRIPQSRIDDGLMFAPIGMVEPKEPVSSFDPKDVDLATGERALRKTRSTGFLVSPCYALTNYHSVFGASKEPTADFAVNIFTIDPVEKSYKVTRAVPVARGAYGESGKRSEDDWSLLKLDICSGKRIGWLETDVRRTSLLWNKEVASAGYPGDEYAGDLWIHQSCRLVEQNIVGYENIIFNNCATRSGSSGSPLFDLENGFPQVLAIQSAELNRTLSILPAYDRNHANLAIDIRFILPKINQIISADKKVFGRQNPSYTPPN